MPGQPAKTELRRRVKALSPLVDLIRLMLTEARHAFNLHSRERLENLARLQRDFTLAIDPFFEEVERELQGAGGGGHSEGEKFHQILSHLEVMADRAASLADPLKYKANHGVILSEKEVFAVNALFTRLNGLLQALVDIFKRNDPTLKEYVRKETEEVKRSGFVSVTEHQTQMMDTPGQPAAWSVYLAIQEIARDFLERLEKILSLLP